MGRQKPQRPAANITEVLTPHEPAWRENNRWVEARAKADCLYDEAAFQRIEASIPHDALADKSRDRKEFREMAAALIVDSWKRQEVANKNPEQEQLEKIAEVLDAVLSEIDKISPSVGPGRWLTKAARESSIPLRQVGEFLSKGRNVHALLKCAADHIPKRNRGPKMLARRSVKRLAKFWHDKTGRSVRSGKFELFQKFSDAIVEPLRNAGFDVRYPTEHEVRLVLESK
jgi:hypothetical protein